MKRLLNPRIVIAAVALVVAAGIYIAALPTSEALVIGGPNVCAYYSNATYTTVVGARGTGCCGTVINWGITTQWKRCERLYCTDNLCPF